MGRHRAAPAGRRACRGGSTRWLPSLRPSPAGRRGGSWPTARWMKPGAVAGGPEAGRAWSDELARLGCGAQPCGPVACLGPRWTQPTPSAPGGSWPAIKVRKVCNRPLLVSEGSSRTRAESRVDRRRRSSAAFWRSASSAWLSLASAALTLSRFARCRSSLAKCRSRAASFAARSRDPDAS